MKSLYESSKGAGRTEISLSAYHLGDDIVVFIYNSNAHLGAVAVGEYDSGHKRTSTSVVTRLGHKDDTIAQKAACLISKACQRPACVVAGIHIDNISEEEINIILENVRLAVEEFISKTLR